MSLKRRQIFLTRNLYLLGLGFFLRLFDLRIILSPGALFGRLRGILLSLLFCVLGRIFRGAEFLAAAFFSEVGRRFSALIGGFRFIIFHLGPIFKQECNHTALDNHILNDLVSLIILVPKYVVNDLENLLVQDIRAVEVDKNLKDFLEEPSLHDSVIDVSSKTREHRRSVLYELNNGLKKRAQPSLLLLHQILTDLAQLLVHLSVDELLDDHIYELEHVRVTQVLQDILVLLGIS